MWTVLTATAKMPVSCWGRYRRVALVQLTQHATAHDIAPSMISDRSRAILRLVDMGRHNEGKTDRCAAAKVTAEAWRRAAALNNAATVEAGDDLLMTWGGSA